jgi:hypothetical protein
MSDNHKKQLLNTSSYGYKNDHHLIREKVPPVSLTMLRQELLLSQHRDIFIASQRAPTFEDAIGIIAAMLDIALDGEYEPDDLFTMLVQALRSRDSKGTAAHEQASGLVSAELVEREDTVTLEFGGMTLAPQQAKEVEAGRQGVIADHSRFMQEAGCDICESRAACKSAARCLGTESYDAGQELAEKEE